MKDMGTREIYTRALNFVYSEASKSGENGISETCLLMSINNENKSNKILDIPNEITPFSIIEDLQKSKTRTIVRFYKEGYGEGFYKIAA